MKIVKNKLFEKIIYYAIILNLIAMVISTGIISASFVDIINQSSKDK